jgi:hypothetical protein
MNHQEIRFNILHENFSSDLQKWQ